jgi:hypothetical protein
MQPATIAAILTLRFWNASFRSNFMMMLLSGMPLESSRINGEKIVQDTLFGGNAVQHWLAIVYAHPFTSATRA